MLSVVDAIMYRTCPYKDSDSLVSLYETSHYVDSTTGIPVTRQWDGTSLAGFNDWRDQSHVFEHLVVANPWDGMVRTADRTEKCRGHFVSPEFFSVLGIKSNIGRSFLSEEHRQGGGRVAIISHDHWRHWFASDPNVVGKTLVLDKEIYTVIGVLPEDFRYFSA
jgi:putative ABC transport system permease protein